MALRLHQLIFLPCPLFFVLSTLRCFLDLVERQMEENWLKVVCGHPVTVATLLSISLLLLQRGLRQDEGPSAVDSDFRAIWHPKRLRLCSLPCDSLSHGRRRLTCAFKVTTLESFPSRNPF